MQAIAPMNRSFGDEIGLLGRRLPRTSPTTSAGCSRRIPRPRALQALSWPTRHVHPSCAAAGLELLPPRAEGPPPSLSTTRPQKEVSVIR